MGELDIEKLDISDLKNKVIDYSVDAVSTDAGGDQKEFTWQSTSWTRNYGYYTIIPEFKIAIDTKANWTAGSGFETDPATEMLLGSIRGNKKDTFTSILKNQVKVKTLDGDSYAEIIRDDDDILVNLKPLAPDSIKSVQNSRGLFNRYEQVSKIMGNPNKIFQVEDIFHLSRERMADEIHGVSVVPAVKWIILARNEAMADWRKVLHRNLYPVNVHHLDTDDTSKIAAYKTKADLAKSQGEDLFVPKGAVEITPGSVTAPNATLNPLPWIDKLNDYFFQVVNVPQIILGNAKEFTDASGKIVYLSYEQSVKGEQLYIEEQILNQLNLEIKLIFPASLQNELISGQPAEMGLEEEPIKEASQPNDTIEELEGKK